MKFRHIFAIVLCVTFAAAYAFAATRPRMNIENPKEYSVYASFYPVYSISRDILDGIPGIRVMQLTQPTDNDISAYSLSDWDAALLESADVLVMGGSGLEPFAGYSNNHSIVISLLSGAEFMQSEDGKANPWVFMSLDGMQYAAEAMCANMITVDEGCEQMYISNLERFTTSVEAVRKDMSELSFEGKVAVTHNAFEYLMNDLRIDYLRISDADDIAEAGENQINVVFCDRAFMSEYDDLICENGLKAVCLDTGMAHRNGDSKSLLDIYVENVGIITAELSR